VMYWIVEPNVGLATTVAQRALRVNKSRV
jgi:hypothetical protein